MPTLALSALGIVFGDIGTSPLYTFKTVLGTADMPSDPATVLGALSLVLWTLFLITTIKAATYFDLDHLLPTVPGRSVLAARACGDLPLREEWLQTQPRGPSLWRRLMGHKKGV